MQPDVSRPASARASFAVLRSRIIGTALLGIAVLVYWLGALSGIW